MPATLSAHHQLSSCWPQRDHSPAANLRETTIPQGKKGSSSWELGLRWLHSQLLQTQLLPPGLRHYQDCSVCTSQKLQSQNLCHLPEITWRSHNKQEYSSLWPRPLTTGQNPIPCLSRRFTCTGQEICLTQQPHPSWKVGHKWIQNPVLWFASCKYLNFLPSGSVCKNVHRLIGLWLLDEMMYESAYHHS